MSGPQCCSNPPFLDSTYGEGYVLEVGGLKSYVTGSPASKTGILLVSDIFGYEAPKLRKLADKIAASGFFVVVPDFFYGDPFLYENVEKSLPVWLKSHGWEKGFEDAKLVIAAMKSQGITAVGAAGFCWGAKVTVQLAKPDYIQAAVMLHPSFVAVDELKEVYVPIAILGAEVDKYCPPELLRQFEDVLSSKSEVNSFVKMFPGTTHGWTVRYSEEDECDVKSAQEAHEDMLAWFTTHVK
ncbi:hypothetical protein NMG60_11032166 [Bertholletia excelsa]